MFRLPSPRRLSRSRAVAGVTLVELMVSASILTIVSLGILGGLIQSRRLTEASLYQNSAVTAMQGYLEQMKNMEFNEIPYYSSGVLMRGALTTADDVIYTRLDNDTPDHLRLSDGAIPALTTFRSAAASASGAATAGSASRTAVITHVDFDEDMIDNVKVIDINNTDSALDDLVLHIWVWITPLDSAPDGVSAARAMTMVYTWFYNDGGKVRTGTDSVRTVRSAVPTF